MCKRLLLLVLILMLVYTASYADHILGGALTYKFQSSTSGKVSYQLKLTLYLQCDDNSIPEDTSILLGTYLNNKEKSLYRLDTIFISNYKTYSPNCNSSATACIKVCNYSKRIELDTSSLGYFSMYSRCCRNEDLVNLSKKSNNPQGIYLFAYIPPTNVKNNSPDFLFPPTDLHGINKTVNLNSGVIETDGDSLVYEIVPPMIILFNFDPVPIPKSKMENFIYAEYNQGFSKERPLGDSALVLIDKTTGVLTFKNSSEGSFAFCIEIREFRKGKLIGITLKDFPLIFSKTPFNNSDDTIIIDKPFVYWGNQVVLRWKTCPYSVPEFILERKQAGINWAEIYKGSDLYFDDTISDSTWYYYRVKAFIRGKYRYSNIDSVNNDIVEITGGARHNIKNEINIYPNPAGDYLIVENNSNSTCEIYDYLGNLILEFGKINQKNGIRLDIASLKQGLYILVLKTEQTLSYKRFIKN
jgi:hypothetical protein